MVKENVFFSLIGRKKEKDNIPIRTPQNIKVVKICVGARAWL